MNQQEQKLINDSKNAIEGLISLLNLMTIEEVDYYVKNKVKWFQTGHGQIAIRVVKDLQEYEDSK